MKIAISLLLIALSAAQAAEVLPTDAMIDAVQKYVTARQERSLMSSRNLQGDPTACFAKYPKIEEWYESVESGCAKDLEANSESAMTDSQTVSTNLFTSTDASSAEANKKVACEAMASSAVFTCVGGAPWDDFLSLASDTSSACAAYSAQFGQIESMQLPEGVTLGDSVTQLQTDCAAVGVTITFSGSSALSPSLATMFGVLALLVAAMM